MINTNFHPFPGLETERLLLRKVTDADAGEIFFLRSDTNVLRYIKKEPAKNVEEARDFIKRINEDIAKGESILWAITLKDNINARDPGSYHGVLIGTICLWQFKREHFRAEIGYVLHPGYWRRGIMKEAILKVADFGFSFMELHSIEAHINPDNTGSAGVLEATGFVREACFKENYFFRGKFLDTAIYSRLNK